MWCALTISLLLASLSAEATLRAATTPHADPVVATGGTIARRQSPLIDAIYED